MYLKLQSEGQDSACSTHAHMQWVRMHMTVCVLSCFSRVRLFVTLWTVAHQAPLSMGFSRQEHWSVLPCPPPRDLPNPGIEPFFLMSPALAGGYFTTSTTREDWTVHKHLHYFFSFIFISWRLITLQYCSGFCHTLTWISHGFTCVPHPHPPSHLHPHPIPLGLPSAPALSTCLMHPT